MLRRSLCRFQLTVSNTNAKIRAPSLSLLRRVHSTTSASSSHAIINFNSIRRISSTSTFPSSELRKLGLPLIGLGLCMYWAIVTYLSYREKNRCDAQSGVGKALVSGEVVMVREILPGARTKRQIEFWAHDLGCSYATANGTSFGSAIFSGPFDAHDTYFKEDALFRLSPAFAAEIQVATYDLGGKLLSLLDDAVNDPALLERLGVPPWMHEHLRHSWVNDVRCRDVLARMDFAVDANHGTPILLEINADTPTVLVESAVLDAKFKSEVLPEHYRTQLILAEERKKKKEDSNNVDLSAAPPLTAASIPSLGTCNWIADAIVDQYQRLLQSFSSNNIQIDKFIAAYEPSHDEELRDTCNFATSMFEKAFRQHQRSNSLFLGFFGVKKPEISTTTVSELAKSWEDSSDPGKNDSTKNVLLEKWYPTEVFALESCSDRYFDQSYKEILNGFSPDQKGHVFLVEPLWKWLLSSKKLLALLYERHSDCEWLVPAFIASDLYSSSSADQKEQTSRLPEDFKMHTDASGWVAKSALGREGNTLLLSRDRCTHTEHYKHAKEFIDFVEKKEAEHLLRAGDGDLVSMDNFVIQKYVDSFCLAGRTPIFGSWLIGAQPVGITIREDRGITRDYSSFVPHVVDSALLDSNRHRSFISADLQQKCIPELPRVGEIRERLYGPDNVCLDPKYLNFFALNTHETLEELKKSQSAHRRHGGSVWVWSRLGGSSSANSTPSDTGAKRTTSAESGPQPPPKSRAPSRPTGSIFAKSSTFSRARG